MGLISSGIDRVRAFGLPCGIRGDGSSIGTSHTVLVKWKSGWEDKLYQVYVNGRYAGVTVDSQQRQMVVQVPALPESAVGIEVFAVEPEQADVDFSDELDLERLCSGKVRICFLRSQELAKDSVVWIYFDNGKGEIDYEEPINNQPIEVWPAWQDKAGFGMSRFGAVDFGYDSAAAVGLGRGCFGQGQFGIEADMFEWVSEPLGIGVYRFGVKVTDAAGNQSYACESDEVTVIPAARPAEQVKIESYDKQTNQLVLSVL